MTQTYKVSFTHDFRLQCEEHLDDWCDCRAHFIRDRMDSSNLFTALAADDLLADSPEPLDLLLPVMPTKNIWAPVRLKPAGRGLAVSNPNSPEEVYGVISEGEGLADIRALWFDAFEVQVETEGVLGQDAKNGSVLLLLCKGNHRWKAARAAQLIDNPTTARDYNLSIKITGKCPTCNRDENYDDLIPDEEPVKRSVWRQQHQYDPSSDSGW